MIYRQYIILIGIVLSIFSVGALGVNVETDSTSLTTYTGNASNISQLGDTTIGGSQTDNQALAWDTSTSMWIPQTLVGSDTDTNASTECTGAEVLLGNESCHSITPFVTGGSGDNVSWNQSLATDLYIDVGALWNATFNASFGDLDSDTVTTIWDATFNASFTDLDSDTIFDVTNVAWVNESNTCTDNQNMSNNNLTTVNCIVFESGGEICSGT